MIKFSEISIGEKFLDSFGEACLKIGTNEAVDKWCTKWFYYHFDDNELVSK